MSRSVLRLSTRKFGQMGVIVLFSYRSLSKTRPDRNETKNKEQKKFTKSSVRSSAVRRTGTGNTEFYEQMNNDKKTLSR